MPTSLLGLLLFVMSVFPGVGYLLGREARHPTRDHNGFRETASIVFAGIIAVTVSAFVFAGLRALTPSHTPDVGELLRDPDPYIRANLPYVSAWAVGILVLATAGAYLAGLVAPRLRGGVDFESAWWKAFKHKPGGVESHRVHVGCELADGSYVAGWLWSYATAVEENLDRDLLLVAPITYRASNDDDEVPLDHAAVVVGASKINFVGVTYVELEPEPHEDLGADGGEVAV